MRSSSGTGTYFIGLDHLRALGAFMVVTWHFIHGMNRMNGYPVPFDYTPIIFPFSLLDEGHTGVAIFFTLSGYLFAKLLGDKTIDYKAFFWNRGLRIFPLLAVVILVIGVRKIMEGQNIYAYALSIAEGAIFPILPNGGWAITVEFHFYLILPLILWMLRKSKFLLIVIVGIAIALRLLIYQEQGEVQTLSYYTIVGRIDQFVLGMLIFQFRAYFAYRNILAIGVLITFALVFRYFNLQGGFYQNPIYPSPDLLWVFLPTIEGIAYAVLIAWYDNFSFSSPSGVSRFIGRIGEYSYSIYLLHFFAVFKAAQFVNERIMDISGLYIACLWSVIFFLLMIPIGYLSYRFIEAPFLKLRRPYMAHHIK